MADILYEPFIRVVMWRSTSCLAPLSPLHRLDERRLAGGLGSVLVRVFDRPPTTVRLGRMKGAMQEILFVVEEAEDGSYRASAAAAAIHTETGNLIPARRRP